MYGGWAFDLLLPRIDEFHIYIFTNPDTELSNLMIFAKIYFESMSAVLLYCRQYKDTSN